MTRGNARTRARLWIHAPSHSPARRRASRMLRNVVARPAGLPPTGAACRRLMMSMHLRGTLQVDTCRLMLSCGPRCWNIMLCEDSLCRTIDLPLRTMAKQRSSSRTSDARTHASCWICAPSCARVDASLRCCVIQWYTLPYHFLRRRLAGSTVPSLGPGSIARNSDAPLGARAHYQSVQGYHCSWMSNVHERCGSVSHSECKQQLTCRGTGSGPSHGVCHATRYTAVGLSSACCAAPDPRPRSANDTLSLATVSDE